MMRKRVKIAGIGKEVAWNIRAVQECVRCDIVAAASSGKN